MNSTLRKDAETIIRAAIAAVRPDAAVTRALSGLTFPGRVLLVSAGKAGWQMASAAIRCLNVPADGGIVLTKYGHVAGRLHGLTCFEAGHPVPDANSFRGTQAVLDLTADLGPEDTVLFLLSGGGSALFEKPLIDPEELRSITEQLLACGADIVEMNTIRKRLSAVKGGRFARWCAPARVEAVILSDIVGDPLDMIASGPAAADPSTCGQAMAIVEKYRLRLSAPALDCLRRETPKTAGNVHTQVIGSVRELCRGGESVMRGIGLPPADPDGPPGRRSQRGGNRAGESLEGSAARVRQDRSHCRWRDRRPPHRVRPGGTESGAGPGRGGGAAGYAECRPHQRGL